MRHIKEIITGSIPNHFMWNENPVSLDNKTMFCTAKQESWEKRVDKNLCIFGYKHIFISSNMHLGTDKSFYYLKAYQNVLMRRYRRRSFEELEGSKIIITAKTLDELYIKMYSDPDFVKFIIEK